MLQVIDELQLVQISLALFVQREAWVARVEAPGLSDQSIEARHIGLDIGDPHLQRADALRP